MYIALLVFHILICLALMGVVLVQSGKGGGLAGGAFGGSAQTVFGGRGATDFITRATMILGGLFFVTSLVLAMMSSGFGRAPRSLLQSQTPATAPATPGAARPGTAPTTGTPTAPQGTNPATPQGGSPAAPQSAPPPSGSSQPPSGGGR
jgi:preprotein translocase subunit SecG